MTTLTFDTLAYAKKLKSVGFTEEQAEAQAETIITLITEQLVTREYLDVRLKELELKINAVEASLKRDIKELDLKINAVEASLKRDIKELEVKIKELDLKINAVEASLKRDIKELEVKLTRDMKEMELRLKHDLTLRLGGMLAAGIGIVATIVKLIH